MGRLIVLRRVGTAAALVSSVLLGAGTPHMVAAQTGLAITTPFPAVSVQPGESVTFDLTVSADDPSRVDLSLQGLPDGWSGSMSGGGNEVRRA